MGNFPFLACLNVPCLFTLPQNHAPVMRNGPHTCRWNTATMLRVSRKELILLRITTPGRRYHDLVCSQRRLTEAQGSIFPSSPPPATQPVLSDSEILRLSISSVVIFKSLVSKPFHIHHNSWTSQWLSKQSWYQTIASLCGFIITEVHMIMVSKSLTGP